MKYWDKSWSLVEGCTPVSPACDNCWLAAMEYRFGDKRPTGNLTDFKGRFIGEIEIHKDRLDIPLKTKKPTVFAIWSDLFHEKVPDEFIQNVFGVMDEAHRHKYLICTKRPHIAANYIAMHSIPYVTEHIYLGTTVENQEQADKRIPKLLKCRPFKLFLSVEPMLEKINIKNICIDVSTEKNQGDVRCIADIDAIICGCESGPHARETKEEWVRDLRDQCLVADIPFWVKQLREGKQLVQDHYLSIVNPYYLPWRKHAD